jgi:hypothetical protein
MTGMIGYNGETAVGMNNPEPKMVNPTVTEHLEAKKAALERQLADVTGALDALKKNPEVEAAFNAVQKALY